MCMHARMRRLVWSGDGTYVHRRPARGKICACAFLVDVVNRYCNKWRLKANVSKSAVMVFSKNSVEGGWK